MHLSDFQIAVLELLKSKALSSDMTFLPVKKLIHLKWIINYFASHQI